MRLIVIGMELKATFTIVQTLLMHRVMLQKCFTCMKTNLTMRTNEDFRCGSFRPFDLFDRPPESVSMAAGAGEGGRRETRSRLQPLQKRVDRLLIVGLKKFVDLLVQGMLCGHPSLVKERD